MPNTKTTTKSPAKKQSQVTPEDHLVDPLDGVGDFLSSLNAYEEINNAEYSADPALTARMNDTSLSNNQRKKAAKARNDQQRTAVGDVMNGLFSSGAIRGGDVRATYQSSHDSGNDFGAETSLEGVWGDDYVLHGHYNEDGSVKGGSMGLKRSDNAKGMRIGHGHTDGLASEPGKLKKHFKDHNP